MGITLEEYLLLSEARGIQERLDPSEPRNDHRSAGTLRRWIRGSAMGVCQALRNDRQSPQSRIRNGVVLVAEKRWGEPSCHLFVILLFSEGAQFGRPLFRPNCPFLPGDYAYPSEEFDPCLPEFAPFITRLVNEAMLVDCEIYLSFAGGKVPVQR
jgi:hypothetical protein